MIRKSLHARGFAVGKTSLVSRFVHSIFSDRHSPRSASRSTRSPCRCFRADGADPLGHLRKDEFQKVRMSYPCRARRPLLVADGKARDARCGRLAAAGRRARRLKVPFVLALNKVDLADQWQVDHAALEQAGQLGWKVVRTSSEDGRGRRRGVSDPRARWRASKRDWMSNDALQAVGPREIGIFEQGRWNSSAGHTATWMAAQTGIRPSHSWAAFFPRRGNSGRSRGPIA